MTAWTVDFSWDGKFNASAAFGQGTQLLSRQNLFQQFHCLHSVIWIKCLVILFCIPPPLHKFLHLKWFCFFCLFALNLSEFNPWGMASQKAMHSVSLCADHLSGQHLHWYYSKMYIVQVICWANVCTGSVARCMLCWSSIRPVSAGSGARCTLQLIICLPNICTGSVARCALHWLSVRLVSVLGL